MPQVCWVASRTNHIKTFKADGKTIYYQLKIPKYKTQKSMEYIIINSITFKFIKTIQLPL